MSDFFTNQYFPSGYFPTSYFGIGNVSSNVISYYEILHLNTSTSISTTFNVNYNELITLSENVVNIKSSNIYVSDIVSLHETTNAYISNNLFVSDIVSLHESTNVHTSSNLYISENVSLHETINVRGNVNIFVSQNIPIRETFTAQHNNYIFVSELIVLQDRNTVSSNVTPEETKIIQDSFGIVQIASTLTSEYHIPRYFYGAGHYNLQDNFTFYGKGKVKKPVSSEKFIASFSLSSRIEAKHIAFNSVLFTKKLDLFAASSGSFALPTGSGLYVIINPLMSASGKSRRGSTIKNRNIVNNLLKAGII